jgi:hypothetical protein
MPNIQPGAGGNPYMATPLSQAQAPNVQPKAPPKTAEKPASDQAQFQHRPTGAERGQRLTSETARLQIHQLIQTAVIQQPEQRPQLQLLNRPAMSSALADTLAAHQPPETANAHAQMAGGSLAAASHQKVRSSNEDSAERNSAQSGKRARQEDQEGEFSSLADAEGGMNQGDSSKDERSDSQKKKQIILQKQSLVSQRQPAPQRPVDTFETATKSPLRPPSRSPQKPAIKKVDTPRTAQHRSAPPKDEWTL